MNQEEARVFWGSPDKGFQGGADDDNGEPKFGLYSLWFEEITDSQGKKRLHTVDEELLGHNYLKLFLTNGYSDCVRRSTYPIRRFTTRKNSKFDPQAVPAHTYYVSSYDESSDVRSRDSATFYRVAEFPSPDEPIVHLPHRPLSLHVFLVVGDTAYGPLRASEVPGRGDDEPLAYMVDPPDIDVVKNYIYNVGKVLEIPYSPLVEQGLVAESDGIHGGFTVNLPEILADASQSERTPFLTPYALAMTIKMAMAGQKSKRKFQAEPLTAALNAAKVPYLASGDRHTITKRLAELNKIRSEDAHDLVITALGDSEAGRKLIDEVIDKNKEQYIAERRQEFDEAIAGLIKEREDKERERNRAEQDLDEARRNLEITRQQTEEELSRRSDTEALDRALEERKREQSEELQRLNEEIETVRSRLKDHYDLSNIQKAITDAEKLHDYLQRRVDDLKNSEREVHAQLQSSELVLQGKLREIAPYVSALNHSPLPASNSADREPLESPSGIVPGAKMDADTARDMAKDYVTSLLSRLSLNHERDYADHALAAFLVAHHQSFVTVLSGPPGVGKTSLCEILAEETHLGSRMLNVSVGRGWLSDRDAIGFHNSMTGQFAAAASGMYDFLQGIQQDDPQSVPPQTILLDEANLSVMEQYWSPFMGLADRAGDGEITLSGGHKLRIPGSLRFLATTNHDATTETLSPRLIDRAAVIQPDLLPRDAYGYDSDLMDVPAYSAHTLSLMFGPAALLGDTTDNSHGAITDIMDVLVDSRPEYGVRFVVSPRKRERINRFVAVLRPLLRASSGIQDGDAHVLAQDYATLFFLLPMIIGVGAGTRQRMDALRAKLSEHSMTMSVGKLDDMLARSAHSLGAISFFQY